MGRDITGEIGDEGETDVYPSSVSAPAEVEAGSDLVVAWTGPANEGDFVSLAKPDAHGGRSEGFQRVAGLEGADVSLRAPDVSGIYEVRYVLGSDRQILARQPITVE